MAAQLLEQRAVTAVFRPGRTALGHHWTLADPEGREIGRTRRTHTGGLVGRTLWKTVTVTGMDAGNDIHADVFDAAGQVIVRLIGRGGKERRVEVAAADGAPVAVVRRDPNLGFTYEDPAGRVVGRVPMGPGQDPPWEIRDAGGGVVAALTREPAREVPLEGLLSDLLGVPSINESTRDFERTMHLGFARSRTYGVTIMVVPEDRLLHLLLVLTPVLAGYSY